MPNFTLPLNVTTDRQNVSLSVSIADFGKLLSAFAAGNGQSTVPQDTGLLPVQRPTPGSVTRTAVLTVPTYGTVGKGLPWVTRGLRAWASGMSQEESAEFVERNLKADQATFRLRTDEVFFVSAPANGGEREQYWCRVTRAGRIETISRSEAQNFLRAREEKEAEDAFEAPEQEQDIEL